MAEPRHDDDDDPPRIIIASWAAILWHINGLENLEGWGALFQELIRTGGKPGALTEIEGVRDVPAICTCCTTPNAVIDCRKRLEASLRLLAQLKGPCPQEVYQAVPKIR